MSLADGPPPLPANLQPLWKAVRTNLGEGVNSTLAAHGGLPERTIQGMRFPAIEANTPTTVIPIVFPMTTPGPPLPDKAVQAGTVMAVLFFAGFLWILPFLFANSRCCCKCFSRRLGTYACIGLVFNLSILSFVVAYEPDIQFNDLFFEAIHIIEVVTDKLQEVLTQVAAVVGVFIAYSFRRKITALLGLDSAMVKVELRDCMTCFSMRRFRSIEISVLRASDLTIGFRSRSLYLRVILGVNEPLHSRPRDDCSTSLNMRERFQLNFDPEDTTQKLSIVIKEQEVVGAAVAQLAPVGGALAGALAGLWTPLGPQGGAVVGGLGGVGAANSLGPEVARIDMSAAFVNGLRETAQQTKLEEQPRAMATGPLVPWREHYFTRVDLVPQGSLWLRIADITADDV